MECAGTSLLNLSGFNTVLHHSISRQHTSSLTLRTPLTSWRPSFFDAPLLSHLPSSNYLKQRSPQPAHSTAHLLNNSSSVNDQALPSATLSANLARPFKMPSVGTSHLTRVSQTQLPVAASASVFCTAEPSSVALWSQPT